MELFLLACPGPPLARSGLRMVALQQVEGIRSLQFPGGGRAYRSSLVEIAKRLGCSQSYLSRGARSHGYSLSRAVRWVRFLHAVALRAEDCPVETMVRRLGFADIACWRGPPPPRCR